MKKLLPALKHIPLLLATVCLMVIFGVPHVHGQTAITPPPGNGWVQIASGLTTPTYTDATCVDGTTCYYAVEAVDQFGTAVDMTFVTGTIPATGSHTVKLTWTEATPGATFTVFQGPPPQPPASAVATVN